MAPRDSSQLEWLSDHADVIIVIRVETIESTWVNRDILFNERTVSPDAANWIVSMVHGALVDVIKGGERLPRGAGEQISLNAEGGTAMMRGTRVDAVVPWEVPFASGRRYLLFGHMYDGRFARDYAYGESSNTGLPSGLWRLRRS